MHDHAEDATETDALYCYYLAAIFISYGKSWGGSWRVFISYAYYDVFNISFISRKSSFSMHLLLRTKFDQDDEPSNFQSNNHINDVFNSIFMYEL